MNTSLEDLKDLEFDHTVLDVLMLYFNSSSEEELEDAIKFDDNGDVESWAELNDVSASRLKRIISNALNQDADFKVISEGDCPECRLELDNDIVLNFVWHAD